VSRLIITYSLSYDWLVRGRPDEDWRPAYELGLRYQAAARAVWAPGEDAVFAAFQSFGLRFWEAWPAYPVHLPEGANAFKDPLTFPLHDDWEGMRTVLVHELCHLHEDHPANAARYQAALARIRATFPDEDETVQYHLVTCTLQRAVLMRAFPGRWRAMVALARGHPLLERTWRLIERHEAEIEWADPLGSLAAW
jgi:hypothetical protein